MGRSNTAPSAAQPSAPVQGGIQLLCFAIGRQEFALPVTDVEAVSKLPAGITGIPGAGEAMLGVMEMRGALVSLVSLRTLLGLGSEGFAEDAARVIVTRVGAELAGLVSDNVRAVVTVPSSVVDAVPPVLTRGAGEAQIQSICRMEGGRLVSVLARDRLFDEQTSARIACGASSGTQAMTEVSSLKNTDEKFLIFHLRDEAYGLPIASVDRIVRRPEKLTRVPRAPSFVQGVMNIEGKMVPIIDQGLRFAVPQADAAQNRKVIVLTIEGQQTGFVVDKVSEIVAIPQAELKSAPIYDDDEMPVIDRVAMFERDGRVIMLLNPKALLDSAERDILAKLAEEEGATSS
jgi:purine-binding chemotaxis protein CheW